MIICPIRAHKANSISLLHVFFKMIHGLQYKLDVWVEDDKIAHIVRFDDIQARLKSEHESCVRYLCSVTPDEAIRTSLCDMLSENMRRLFIKKSKGALTQDSSDIQDKRVVWTR